MVRRKKTKQVDAIRVLNVVRDKRKNVELHHWIDCRMDWRISIILHVILVGTVFTQKWYNDWKISDIHC